MYHLSFYESKQHGTAEFPAEYHYVDKEHPQYNMAFHWHKEWELIRILEGEFLLHTDEGEYLAHAGDVFLLRDGMLHGGTPRDCVYECFLFDLHGLFRDVNSVKKYLRPIYRNQVLPRVSFPDRQPDIYPIVDELMGAFWQVRQQREYLKKELGKSLPADSDIESNISFHFRKNLCELITLGNISRLFAVILDKDYVLPKTGPQENASRRISRLKTVLEYIENHYAQRLTLEELAEAAGMSPKYFCRFFRSVIHQTPMDYVNSFRIEHAASLLCSTDLSVTAVGLECGFNDSSYFVKAFKKYMGQTPGQYQKLNS